MNQDSSSFSGQGQSDPQAEAMKQDFENARDGVTPDVQQGGDIEHPETPAMNLTPSQDFIAQFELDPDLAANDAQQQAKLDLSRADEVGLDKGQDFNLGR